MPGDNNEKLRHAVWWGEEKDALSLLKQGALPDQKFSNGSSLLQHAVWWGYTGIAVALLERGITPDQKFSNGSSLLQHAAWHGYGEIALALSKAKEAKAPNTPKKLEPTAAKESDMVSTQKDEKSSKHTPVTEAKHLCCFDTKQYVDKDRWALTLIREKLRGDTGPSADKHTKIIYEGCDNNGTYFKKFLHLVSTPQAEIKDGDLTSKEIKYADKTATFTVSRMDVERMLNRSKKKEKDVQFSIVGRHSLFTMLPRVCAGSMVDNCFTWAVAQVFNAGVKLPCHDSGVVLFTSSADYVKDEYQEVKRQEQYDITDLCRFAKEGDNEAIEHFFPKSFNVNQLVDPAHSEGPVESYLGRYTPLALAIAYNRFDTVKLLVEQYNANLMLTSGRLRDHTALDCANRNWWGVNKGLCFFSGVPDKKIKEYLLEKKAITFKELKKLAADVDSTASLAKVFSKSG